MGGRRMIALIIIIGFGVLWFCLSKLEENREKDIINIDGILYPCFTMSIDHETKTGVIYDCNAEVFVGNRITFDFSCGFYAGYAEVKEIHYYKNKKKIVLDIIKYNCVD